MGLLSVSFGLIGTVSYLDLTEFKKLVKARLIVLEVNIYLRLTLNACICLIADFRDVCYNLTNYVLEDKGSLGNNRWVEVTFKEDCKYLTRIILKFHSRKY